MNTYKMDFEGYITAEFKFDLIKIFKCHFRMHNCVVVSFRINMIVIQTILTLIECLILILKGYILP